MDNFQFWLYIIIALIYVISRAMKKANQPPSPPSSGRPAEEEVEYEGTETPRRPDRPLTFEELLREITEAKSPKTAAPVSKPLPKPQPAYVDYDDNLGDEEENLEDVEYDYKAKDSVYEVYEKAKTEAFSRPSLEETLINEKKDIEYGRFKEFSMAGKRTLLDEYVAELRRPSGFKKAVVLSEILNRRF